MSLIRLLSGVGTKAHTDEQGQHGCQGSDESHHLPVPAPGLFKSEALLDLVAKFLFGTELLLQ
jgi:hypothetical protein